MNKVSKPLASKLCRLSSFLHHFCQEFENVAKIIKDQKIRMSVRSVAMKTKQYISELHSQLQMLKVVCILPGYRNFNDPAPSMHANKFLPDKKMVELCCDTETYFEEVYRDILNEYFPFKHLRNLLKYQLTGIHSEFRQLRLLDSVMNMPQNSLV